ncbi:MAG TPA: shikimate kinase [Pyrinomonadaceae bacterium]|nr:shikimate kinase [Pyrinomonadaceae bacterium]
MSTPPRIIVTGFMGAGKTTVAEALARAFNCEMLDLDDVIVEVDGRNARTIIDENGEIPFREVETQALCELLEHRTARVVALGGGAWTIERNRALLAEHACFTVWLNAPFELCWQRIVRDSTVDRPFARDEEKAKKLFDERQTIYRLADLRVDVGQGKSVEQIAREIMDSMPVKEDGRSG